jgi:prepilin-type N-terminal cleavage/methylation domain-containing protein
MVTARSGFTLAEVIVSMTLLTIAALAVAATGLVAVQAFTRAEQRERLLDRAQFVLDSLLTLPAHSAGARAVLNAQLSWTATDSTGAFTVSASFANGERIDLPGQR